MIKLGLDIGSRNTKIVIFDDAGPAILHSNWCSTDVSPPKAAHALVQSALQQLGIVPADIQKWAVTGYGRKLMPGHYKILSEISCHAAGCLHLNAALKTVIDIGGQDSRIITLNDQGTVDEFVMNDKCAAGTGRFLEMTAFRLGVEVGELSALAAQSTTDIAIDSTCVVFAESEIINMLTSSRLPSDIIRAVHNSIALRIRMQMAGLVWHEPVAFTGGVAMNADLAQCLARVLSCHVWRSQEPEITAALGAAVLA